jgi:hypothetical protein
VTSVVYCHETEGCKYAIQHMRGNNGITQADNGTFYVVNSPGGQLYVLDKQADNTLVITDVIETGGLLLGAQRSFQRGLTPFGR